MDPRNWFLPCCPLQPLNQPDVDQRLRRDTASTGLCLYSLVDFRLEGHTPSALGPHFKLDFMRLIPEIGKAVLIPEGAYLFQGMWIPPWLRFRILRTLYHNR